jgi:hypothetical protein
MFVNVVSGVGMFTEKTTVIPRDSGGFGVFVQYVCLSVKDNGFRQRQRFPVCRTASSAGKKPVDFL